jgi:hypothetical protein
VSKIYTNIFEILRKNNDYYKETSPIYLDSYQMDRERDFEALGAK